MDFSASRLFPTHVDLHLKKNLQEHSTIFYDLPGLLLRRGQPFTLALTFNQSFDANRSHLALIFQASTWSDVPPVKVPLDGETSNGWSIRRLPSQDETKETNDHLSLQVTSPPDTPIGKYAVGLPMEIGPINLDPFCFL